MMNVASASNILLFHNLGTKSHLHMIFPIIDQLLENGHSVTGVFYASAGVEHNNYTELVIPDLYGAMIDRVSDLYTGNQNKGRTFLDPSHLITMFSEWENIITGGTRMFQTPAFKSLASSNFDLVLTFNPWGFYFGDLFDCPVIVFSPPGAFPSHTQLLGNPFNPSYQPVLTNDFSDPTSFLQRAKNFAMYHVMDLIFRRFADSVVTSSMRKQIGYQGPTMFEIAERRLALILSNSHFITHTPQPLLPNVVDVGGIHINSKQKPLPKDLKKFLDLAVNGAVYVSFGSAIRTSRMSAEKITILMDSFKYLNVPVILKWDENLTDVTDNIFVRQWLPQQEILSHPNVKVFVTHGGLLSVMEALHTETVMVGIPLATDQFANLGRASKHNIAKQLNWDDLTTESLVAAISNAMKNNSMKSSMRKLGRLFRDEKESPLERAVWWIEFVLRNKGASFFKPESLNLFWYQYYLLDVLLVLFLTPFLSILVLVKLILLYSSNTQKEKVD